MRYTSLPLLEETFLRTADNGIYTLQKFSIPVPGEALKLEGLLCTSPQHAGYYYNVVHPKQRILIHYTAGSLRSDIETLTTTNRHVSVPFVIARDGTIYQLFSSKFWSGSIGKGLGNTDTGNAQDKCAIAIELSNYGWLTERQGNLETCYSRVPNKQGIPGPVDRYCSLTETEAYQKAAAPFRGQTYFATFSEAQYQSLIILLRYLTATYNIPRQFLPEPVRYQTTNEVLNFNGIVSHVNYRSDGKWDIGPAFDWNKVIAGVEAATFTPIQFRDEAPTVRDAAPAITSEAQVDALLPQAADATGEDEPYEDLKNVESEATPDVIVEKGGAKQGKKKLYALLVAINNYKENISLTGNLIFPQLSGCVPDGKRLKTYLENDSGFDADIKLITDEKATKAEIARLMNEHLGQAKAGDTALFFFSGHGTQEWADKSIWKQETDGKLECIVCYYDTAADDKFLADKELRYLLHGLSKNGAHLVALFDCCHSADNTRAVKVVKDTFSNVHVKAIECDFPQRPYEGFLFSNEISEAELKEKGEAVLLPEGGHVQLSACESNESALEVSGSGVFTHTLLQVLKAAGGDVSYRALESRIRQYLRNVYEQKPRIYAPKHDIDLTSTNFLNRSSACQKRALGELVYNDAKGWKFTLGAIHGITEQTKTITILDPDTNESYEGEIEAIEIDSCVVTTHAKLRKTKVYNGVVEGLLSTVLNICFQKEGDALKEMQQLLDVVFDKAKFYLVAQEEETAADYVVRMLNGKFFITLPNDPFRPLTAPLKVSDKNVANAIASQLIHLSQWTFLKNLQNQNTAKKLPETVLKAELFIGDSKTSALDQTNTAVIPYTNDNGTWEQTMSVKLTNLSAANLYCSVLYLTSDFGSDSGLLNPPVYMLEPNNTVNLAFDGEASLSIELSEVAKFYNWKEEVEYLKIIVSTELFDVQALLLEPLPKPVIPGAAMEDKTRGTSQSRGLVKRTLSGWTTETITLRLQNPLADKVSETDQSALLSNPETAQFARGLYPNAKPTTAVEKPAAPSGKTLRDGSGIKVPRPAATRGGIASKKAKPLQKSAPPIQEMSEAMPVSPGSDLDQAFSATLDDASGGAAAPQASVTPASATPPAAPTGISAQTREGQLEYAIPGQMQTGKPYECKITIAGAEVDAAVMKLSPDSVHAAIRVAQEMSVQLIDCSGGDCFTVVPLSTERQSIDVGEITKWLFEVTPKQSGNHCLVLKITIDLDGRNKDLDILQKEIIVTASETGTTTGTNQTITRILFVSANPTDTPQLRIGAEARMIGEEIGLAKKRDNFPFTTIQAATVRTLLRAMVQENPAIVHFSGHGNEDGLCLETDDGASKLVDATALDLLFQNFVATLKCVVLNACYAEHQAQVIVTHIPYVVGMKKEINDEAALAFSVGFYQALANGDDVEKAFNLGRVEMALASSGSQEVVVLLKKS